MGKFKVWLCCSDAGWANGQFDDGSQGGYLMMLADKTVFDNDVCKVNVMEWSSRKGKRLARSSLGTEVQALGTNLEPTSWTRALYEEMVTTRPVQYWAESKKSTRGSILWWCGRARAFSIELTH